MSAKEKCNNSPVEKSSERLAVLAKIEEYEKNGTFHKDVEPDPPSIQLKP